MIKVHVRARPLHLPRGNMRVVGMRYLLPIIIAGLSCLHLVHHENLWSPRRAKICVLIPVTSRKQHWTSLEDTFLLPTLKSLASTCEPELFSYKIFIGYDVGDAFFDNRTTLEDITRWTAQHAPFAWLSTLSLSNPRCKPGPMMNFLSSHAYSDGCDFMYQIHDDTDLLTPWTSAFVAALRGFEPPLKGVVGPTCDERLLMMHNFVHRRHLEIFGTHYPVELTDWWMDDWIAFVYGKRNTRKLKEVVVSHHHDSPDMRFEVQWDAHDKLELLLQEGRLRQMTAEWAYPSQLWQHHFF